MHPTLTEAARMMGSVLLERLVPATVAMAYVADVDEGRDLIRLYIYERGTQKGQSQPKSGYHWRHLEHGKKGDPDYRPPRAPERDVLQWLVKTLEPYNPSEPRKELVEAQPEETLETYTVQEGDTWESIADDLLGSRKEARFLMYHNQNNAGNPTRLVPGKDIKFPVQSFESVEDEPAAFEDYTAKAKDTWKSIAKKFYEKPAVALPYLKQSNARGGRELPITAGMKIRIPTELPGRYRPPRIRKDQPLQRDIPYVYTFYIDDLEMASGRRNTPTIFNNVMDQATKPGWLKIMAQPEKSMWLFIMDVDESLEHAEYKYSEEGDLLIPVYEKPDLETETISIKKGITHKVLKNRYDKGGGYGKYKDKADWTLDGLFRELNGANIQDVKPGMTVEMPKPLSPNWYINQPRVGYEVPPGKKEKARRTDVKAGRAMAKEKQFATSHTSERYDETRLRLNIEDLILALGSKLKVEPYSIRAAMEEYIEESGIVSSNVGDLNRMALDPLREVKQIIERLIDKPQLIPAGLKDKIMRWEERGKFELQDAEEGFGDFEDVDDIRRQEMEDEDDDEQ